jgi:hypothetical protein
MMSKTIEETPSIWRRPLCWLQEFWWTLTSGANFSGHIMIDDEVHENVTVTISHCEACGKKEITWEEK